MYAPRVSAMEAGAAGGYGGRGPAPPPHGSASLKFQQTTKWAMDDAPEEDRDGDACGVRTKVGLALLAGLLVIVGVVAVGVILGTQSSSSGSANSIPGPPPPPLPPAPPGGYPPPARRPPPPPSCKPEFKRGKDGVRAGAPANLVIPDPGEPPFNETAGWSAIFWDEFDGAALDTCKWRYDWGDGYDALGCTQRECEYYAWGNEELQWYSDENVAVSDGALQITAKRQAVRDYAYTSGRINTYGKASFAPGMVNPRTGKACAALRVEAAIRAPEPGAGLWAAFWAEPEIKVYGDWAASGELDMYEMKNEMTSTIMGAHFGGEYPEFNRKNTNVEDGSGAKTISAPGGGSFSDDFYRVAMEWEPTRIAHFLEGRKVREYGPCAGGEYPEGLCWYSQPAPGKPAAGPNSPFGGDVPFFLQFNLAVGGRYPKDPTPDTPFPATMSVEYVRVYCKEER